MKNRRKELGLTQSELAADICEQSQISKIENNDYAPSSDILYKLSKRLDVSMEYFFDNNIEDSHTSLTQFKELADNLLKKRDFNALKYLLEVKIEDNIIITSQDAVYIEWLKAIIIYNLKGQKNEAIKRLEKVAHEVKEEHSFYLEFWNVLSSFYYENGEIEQYKKSFLNNIKQAQKLDLTFIDNFQLLIKIRYNYARFLVKNKEAPMAIREILEVIDISKKYHSSYLLPDLFCLLADIGESFLTETEIEDYYNKALILFKVYDNDLMYLSLKEYLSKS